MSAVRRRRRTGGILSFPLWMQKTFGQLDYFLEESSGDVGVATYPGYIPPGNLDADFSGAGIVQPPAGSINLRYGRRFTGTGEYGDWYSPEVNSIFNPNAGTLMVAANVANAGVWTDGQFRNLVMLQGATTDYRLQLRRTNVNNTLQVEFRTNATSEIINTTILGGSTDIFFIAATWEYPGNLSLYINGVLEGTPQPIAFPWQDNLQIATIGAASTSPTFVFYGDIWWDPSLWQRAATQDEITQIYNNLGIG